MNKLSAGKMLLILVMIISTPAIILFAIKSNEKKVAIREQDNVKQALQLEKGREVTEKRQVEDVKQAASENENAQDAVEIVGTIVQVDVVEDESGELLLTVDADIVDQDSSNIQAVDVQDDVELPMVSKRFTVTVAKDTPIAGGTLDGLSEDDIVKVFSRDNFYTTDTLTAINIEEL